MREVEDWRSKDEALRRLAIAQGARNNPTAVIAHFLRRNGTTDAKSVLASKKNSIGRGWHAAGSLTTYFNDVIAKTGFRGEVSRFESSSYEEWLTYFPDDIRLLIEAVDEHRVHPHIRFYPADLKGSPLADWEREGAVDQRFMYDSRVAAASWEKSRNHHTAGASHQYVYCRESLPVVLKKLEAQCRAADEVVFLGSGSPDKDLIVIKRIVELRGPSAAPLRVVICDGSFYMLVETYAALSEALDAAWIDDKTLSDRVTIELCCLDFCNRAAWQICSLQEQVNRLIFMMGGTIGNIREDAFFGAIREAFGTNTTLVIGASFYDSEEQLISDEDHVLQQYGHDAKELVLSSVSRSIQRNYPEIEWNKIIGAVHKQFLRATGDKIPFTMSSRVAGTWAAVFSFQWPNKEKIRLATPIGTLGKLYLAISRRYVKDAFANHAAYFLSATVDWADHPDGKRFSHLILTPEAGSRPD